MKNDFTKFMTKHELTGGFRVERYHSDNVFFNCCKQGAWVYTSLEDFYTDARDALANPNRTTSPVTPLRYQVRYMNIPGLDKPSQPLTAIYGGAYAQDVWRPRTNLSVTLGLRFDVPSFENTAYNNANANALTFRDENGQPVQYDSGKMPGANILWSPRFGFNYDLDGRPEDPDPRRHGRVHRPAALRLDLEPAWQHRRAAGQLAERRRRPPRSRSRPTSTRYKPTNVTGAPAASYELNVTDNDFRFPQVWRSNIAVDRRLPGGITGTAEFMYNRDVNGIYYINANLPAAQTAFTGADNRPRWVGTACAHHRHPCNTRINNAAGNQVTAQHRPEEPGHRPQLEHRVLGVEADVARPVAAHRLQLRRSEEHHRPGFNGQRLVEQQPDARRSEQPRPRLLDRVARPSLLPVRVVHASSTSASARPRSRRSGRAARSATPATSSRPTPTATAARRTT